MQLTIREVTRLLNVSESKVYRWLDAGEIPAYRVKDEVRFNRAELLEWATLRKIPVSEQILREPANGGSLLKALSAGGVVYGIGACEPAAVLRALVDALPAAAPEERSTLAEMLAARAAEALIPMGRGIAIPHVRRPAIASVEGAALVLGFLETPLATPTPDGQPISTLFLLVTPTVRIHLHVLSRLAAALRDAGFLAALGRRAPQPEILAELRRLEVPR